MTLLSTVRDAAPGIGIEVPSQVFGNPSRNMVEMRTLVNEVARQIADEAEWSVLSRIHTITGDGSEEDFALPSDYRRMQKDTKLWSSSITTSPLEQITSMDEWLAMTVQDFTFLFGAWIVYGGEMHIKPARSSGEAVKFFYQTNKLVTAEDTTTKTAFTADTDTFVLSERLLTLGIVTNWKQRKGLDYTEDLALYQNALAYEIGIDKGPATIAVGRRKSSFATTYAYPYGLG